MKPHSSLLRSALLGLCLAFTLDAQTLEPKPSDAYFSKFNPLKAPEPKSPLLKKGDRLAICGDSITEQKMYSRILETYLTVCVPDLEITARQYGWSGEKAPGFLARMANDCLRFQPTIATTCYGMNDHEYRIYEEKIGTQYREAMVGIVKAFKAAGARVVLGSPGAIGVKPAWSKDAAASAEDLNLGLCELRNIDVKIAEKEGVGFADVFWPMLTAGHAAQNKHGAQFALPGRDGVHPDWAGQLVMAYCFLKALGLDGDLGRVAIDFGKKSKMGSGTGGHQVKEENQEPSGKWLLTIQSSRYPFCIKRGDETTHDNIYSGTRWVPFFRDLDRFTLTVKNGKASRYKVAWGRDDHTYTSAELAKGINLAEEFPENPFSEAFGAVDKAVGEKQAYETRQIKTLFHGPEGAADKELTATLTEKARAPLAAAIKKAFVPVTHTLEITALP